MGALRGLVPFSLYRMTLLAFEPHHLGLGLVSFSFSFFVFGLFLSSFLNVMHAYFKKINNKEVSKRKVNGFSSFSVLLFP